MVNLSTQLVLAADQANQMVLQKLDPERRVAVVLALIGLGILGVMLIAAAMLAARWARQGRPPRKGLLDEPPRKPPSNTEIPPAAPWGDNQGETIVEKPNDDTMTG